MSDPFAKPEGYISVVSMFGRGLIALAMGAVVMAITVPLAYWVGDRVTESKRRRHQKIMEEDGPVTLVGRPACGPSVDPVEFIKAWKRSDETLTTDKDQTPAESVREAA